MHVWMLDQWPQLETVTIVCLFASSAAMALIIFVPKKTRAYPSEQEDAWPWLDDTRDSTTTKNESFQSSLDLSSPKAPYIYIPGFRASNKGTTTTILLSNTQCHARKLCSTTSILPCTDNHDDDVDGEWRCMSKVTIDGRYTGASSPSWPRTKKNTIEDYLFTSDNLELCRDTITIRAYHDHVWKSPRQ